MSTIFLFDVHILFNLIIRQEKIMEMRFCVSGHHEVRDDGKGSMRTCGNGMQQWRCSACTERADENKAALRKPSGVLKKAPGRKPKPRYEEVMESAAEERDFIRRVLGI